MNPPGARTAMIDKDGCLMVAEIKSTIQEMKDLIDEHFGGMFPLPMRYERIVVQRSPRYGEEEMFLIHPRPTDFFASDTAREVRLPAYRSFAQILDAATARSDYRLSKMVLVIPYGSPEEMTLAIID